MFEQYFKKMRAMGDYYDELDCRSKEIKRKILDLEFAICGGRSISRDSLLLMLKNETEMVEKKFFDELDCVLEMIIKKLENDEKSFLYRRIYSYESGWKNGSIYSMITFYFDVEGDEEDYTLDPKKLISCPWVSFIDE